MYELTPQTVLVKEGFKRNTQIKVQISHLGAMIVDQALHMGSFSHISGVDRLFVAPELNTFKLGPKCDVWSIGVILYLIITGGVADKRHEEVFNFNEPIWFTISEELKEFMLMALAVDPKQRASVD